jgi:hypothetical protein
MNRNFEAPWLTVVRACAVAGLVFFAVQRSAEADTSFRTILPASEYQALIDFFNQTGGPNWYTKYGWNDPNYQGSWYGVNVKEFFNDGGTPTYHVTELNIDYNNLTGPIPATLQNLPYLQELDLYGNALTGPLPDWLAHLPILGLDLSDNQLTGPIPPSLGNLYNQQYQLSAAVWLSGNHLTGSIPESLENLSLVELQNNELTGDVPAWVNLPAGRAYYFDLETNYLDATSAVSQDRIAAQKARGMDLDVSGQKPRLTLCRINSAAGYTGVSTSEASQVDAPLVPVADPLALTDNTSQVSMGLMADGVTPLIIKIDYHSSGGSNEVQVDLENWSGGSLTQGKPQIQVLTPDENGDGGFTWQPWHQGDYLPTFTDDRTIADGHDYAYAYIAPLSATDLTITGNGPDINAKAVETNDDLITDDDSFTQIPIAFAKPIIALVHGYNTPGTWGIDFKAILAVDHPLEEIHYGVNGGDYTPNRDWSFADLSALLYNQLQQQVDPGSSSWGAKWAYTRYDVVAHSQGGILTRMLCAQQSLSQYPLPSKAQVQIPPFRNKGNFFRGRFHRVITIGSPLNGTRLLRYMLDLTGPIAAAIPNSLMGTLNPKFDPWGPQIMDFNKSLGPYSPDPNAKVCMIRTSINGGFPPGSNQSAKILAYTSIGLSNPEKGQAVLPRGSDGIVDFDSAGAGNSSGVVTLSGVDVAHSDGGLCSGGCGEIFQLFDTLNYDVNSTNVANKVEFILGVDGGFAPCMTSNLASPTDRQMVDNAAAKALFVGPGIGLFSGSAGSSIRSASKGVRPQDTSYSYSFYLSAPAAYPPSANVYWTAEIIGNGVSQNGVTVIPDPNDPTKVTVTVDSSVVGDVMLYVSYEATNGSFVFVSPTLVASNPPVGVTVQSLTLLPLNTSVPSGKTERVTVSATYSDGSSLQINTLAGAVSFSSSNPNVANIDSAGTLTTPTAGSATITATYQGVTAQSVITVTPAWTPYQYWKFDNLADINADDNADPAGDGVSNLMKYALGLNPFVSVSPGSLGVSGFSTYAGDEYLSLQFQRSLSATDVTFQIEISSDLAQPWLEGSSYGPGGDVPNTAYITEVSRSDSGNFETITVRDAVPVRQELHRFIRLKVSH